jgi:hypothetical protein
MKTHVLLYIYLQCKLLHNYIAASISGEFSEERCIYMSSRFLCTSHGLGSVKKEKDAVGTFSKNTFKNLTILLSIPLRPLE